jgi:hypothetical protein
MQAGTTGPQAGPIFEFSALRENEIVISGDDSSAAILEDRRGI